MHSTPADLARAIALAATAHFDQLDKSGSPYILHPIRVMQQVTEHGLTAQIVAVLHDVVEDTWVTLDLLRQAGFSEPVVEAVDSVTRREGEQYLVYVARAARHPVGAIVKLADLADNLDPARRIPQSSGLQERYGKARVIVEAAIAARRQESEPGTINPPTDEPAGTP